MKNYYQLLEVAPEASVDAVKRAFRLQIARYHPDKVQHLGREFQAMAADRAAELTEAYRVLSNPASRAEYDRLLTAGGGTDSAPPASRSATPPPFETPVATPDSSEPAPPPTDAFR